jgi:putative transposase
MPRTLRSYDDDAVLHVVNRGNDRRQLFASDRDYAVFIGLMAWAQARATLRVLAYALMPNHWHLVVWPRSAPELSQFMHDLTGAHAAILRTESGTKGAGHIYQDRYHAFVVDSELRYYRTLRYVEANPVRAGLVLRAQQWRWSSLQERLWEPRLISTGPVPLPPPDDWAALVNVVLTPHEVSSLRPKRPRKGVANLWSGQLNSGTQFRPPRQL